MKKTIPMEFRVQVDQVLPNDDTERVSKSVTQLDIRLPGHWIQVTPTQLIVRKGGYLAQGDSNVLLSVPIHEGHVS